MTGTTGTTNDGFNSGSTQYLDTGIHLQVTPRVNPGGLVYLEVGQSVSKPGAKSDADISGNVPIEQRQLTTEIAVQSGQTVLLGGLIQDTTQDSENGIPGLSRIPILGRLFGSTTRSNQRTELFRPHHPRVITSTEKPAPSPTSTSAASKACVRCATCAAPKPVCRRTSNESPDPRPRPLALTVLAGCATAPSGGSSAGKGAHGTWRSAPCSVGSCSSRTRPKRPMPISRQGFRATKSQADYARENNNRPVQWKSVQFLDKDCREDSCTGAPEMDYTPADPGCAQSERDLAFWRRSGSRFREGGTPRASLARP